MKLKKNKEKFDEARKMGSDIERNNFLCDNKTYV
jgi:hypothetical protein